jgi:uncharacterized repeat protein (TIGR04076 family)
MVRKYKLEITVIKKMNAMDVYGKLLPEVMDDMAPYCPVFEEGQEFIINEAGEMPAKFCNWAWHDIFPSITTLRFGGSFPWMKEERMVYACCTDGARPVFFRLKRIED